MAGGGIDLGPIEARHARAEKSELEKIADRLRAICDAFEGININLSATADRILGPAPAPNAPSGPPPSGEVGAIASVNSILDDIEYVQDQMRDGAMARLSSL